MSDPIKIREVEHGPTKYVENEYTYEELLDLFGEDPKDSLVSALVHRCMEYEKRLARTLFKYEKKNIDC